METSRREFLGGLAGLAALGSGGCLSVGTERRGRIALQLYSIRHYIGGLKDKDGKVTVPARGLERALEDVASIGYEGVEFAGHYGCDAKRLKAALAGAGLVPCGMIGSTDLIGLDTDRWAYDPEALKRTCAFELSYGNDLLVSGGGGNFPPGCSWSLGQDGETCRPSQAIDDFIKRLVEHYNRAAADAAKLGCRIALHNHTWEHAVFLRDGTSFWDYFFSRTDARICMEQDVGWSTCAGVDPKAQYLKYPHRSPTLHAKENGMGKNVKEFDAILGRPGKPGATPVDWDGLIPVAEADGVKWWIVECERHFEDLSAVTPSYAFLESKGFRKGDRAC